MKYIIGKTGFAIFDEGQEHIKIARSMYAKPVSAGYVTLINGKFRCSGHSVTLGLESREEDSEILNQKAEDYA